MWNTIAVPHCEIRRLLAPAAGRAIAAIAVFFCASTPASAQRAEPPTTPEVTYEIFVQSFCDSDGDGIGDFRGMTSKLGYLDSLGIDAVWLMPIMPSPSYHKYDVTDYRAVHPDYGTLADFKAFVEAAHQRDIRVIIDLVVNHTARDHPWFQSALEGERNPYRDYYVWATAEEVAARAPVASRGGELELGQWHDAPGPDGYYGFFWGGMPDLNFDNPKVRQELIEIGRFWLEEVGVDGFRLDAARHIYPDARAVDSQQWWVEFRQAMKAIDQDVYLVGEVWATAEETAPYFRGIDALFNFDVSLALQQALETGRADSLAVLHQRIRDDYRRQTEEFTDATFLTNHDQNRIRSVLGGSIKKAEMGASLLFTLPGDPYIYYGEEIGMLGKKPDPHIREPMLWTAGNETCRADWIVPVYSTDATVTPASAQLGRQGSLLEHYRQLIRLRKDQPALAQGEIEAIPPEHPSISAFLRILGGDTLLVVHNVASQNVEVRFPEQLSGFRERVWANGGVNNTDRGNSALGRGSVQEGAAAPMLVGERMLRMPGLSTVVLRRP